MEQNEFSITLVFMVTKNRATVETINTAPVSLVEHSWKLKAMNIPLDKYNCNEWTEKQAETTFCSLEGYKFKAARKISACITASKEY